MAGTERVLPPPPTLLPDDDEVVETADEVAVEGVEDAAEALTRMPIRAADDARCGAAIVGRAAGRRRRHHRRGEGLREENAWCWNSSTQIQGWAGGCAPRLG